MLTAKQQEYAEKLLKGIFYVIGKEDWQLNIQELEDSNNAHDFMVALGALIPTHIYNSFFVSAVEPKKTLPWVNHLLSDLIYERVLNRKGEVGTAPEHRENSDAKEGESEAPGKEESEI